MEINTSFFELASQGDERAYKREVQDLIRKNHTQQQDGDPPSKRPRLSQDSQYGSQRESDYPGADGTIRSITMENFMCHGNLKLEFNPKVNFLIGQNGSGKSAILTAITVGLGAQARETGRGKSLKDLIKTGSSSASVIIELFNKKRRRLDDTVLEPGKIITIKRTIGTASTVQIKYQNRVISSRVDGLHSLMRSMGIQINNPISVLDQNTSKTFLAQSTPTVKYELFMRATALEDIKRCHQEINSRIRSIELDVKKKKNDLKSRMDFDKDLVKKFKEVEALMGLRSERSEVLEELLWSKANTFDVQLKEKERQHERVSRELKDQQRRMEADKEEDEFAADIAKLDAELEFISERKVKLEKEMRECREETASKLSSTQREELDLKRMQQKMVSLKARVSDYKKQIENEVALGDPTERLRNQRERIQFLTDDVQRLEKELESKENAKFQSQQNVRRIQDDYNNAEGSKRDAEARLRKLEGSMRAISQDNSASTLSIFGDYMVDLVDQIKASAKSFRKLPVGPLGLYVKLLDERWGPAVESVCGNLLTSFCVDNTDDEIKLKAIMKRVCRGNWPTILKGKFFDKPHDTSRFAARTREYQNILDVLEFSHPMAANMLIDQSAIERVMLIPDDAACQKLLSDERTVPRNCAYAVTLKRDKYYPAPLYRTYAAHGKNNNTRYLKASKEAVLQNLRQNVAEAREAVRAVDAQRREVDAQLRAAQAEAREFDSSIRDITSKLQLKKRELNELKNQEEPEESFVVSLRAELRSREEELAELKAKIEKQTEEVRKLKISYEEQSAAQKNLQRDFDELKAHESKFKEEKDVLNDNRARSCQQRETRKEKLQALGATIKALETEIKGFKEELAKAREEAQKYGAVGDDADTERASRTQTTRRRPAEIEKDLMALDTKIRTLERTIGTDEESILRRYRDMKKNVATIEALLKRNELCIKALHEAMEYRLAVFEGLMRMNKIAIDTTFRRVLRQRKYKGSLDFTNSKMEINIGLSEDDSRSTSTLSGGERSFGTMALLISLWYVTKLPFYFMDEFDVFMDMANRETIMDLMMDYTRKRDYQFCFLTPLNTSNIQADKDVSIHRLEPPRKN